MLPSTDLLHRKFDEALPFESFLALAERENHRGSWDMRYSQLVLSEAQRELVRGFQRQINVLCMTGTWCGDCALQGASIERIAEANPQHITARFLNRTEEHAELITRCQINGGFRVPMTWFLAEDFAPAHVFGDRTLSRYRAMARKQLPADAVTIVAQPPADPVRAVLEEMLDEFERVHLLLRLSPRLRQKHGD